MKTNEKRELSYFQSLLGKYISEHHPELSNDKAFLSSRADEALNVYANAITIGFSDLEAEEAANEVLYNGLHFSKYDTIVEVLWNEFAENIPQSLAERLAAILLGNTAIQKTFAKYKLDDDFDGKPEYDELYTELTGCIQIIIEKKRAPCFLIQFYQLKSGQPLFKSKGYFRLSIGKDSQRQWKKFPPEGCIYPIVLAFSEIRPL